MYWHRKPLILCLSITPNCILNLLNAFCQHAKKNKKIVVFSSKYFESRVFKATCTVDFKPAFLGILHSLVSWNRCTAISTNVCIYIDSNDTNYYVLSSPACLVMSINSHSYHPNILLYSVSLWGENMINDSVQAIPFYPVYSCSFLILVKLVKTWFCPAGSGDSDGYIWCLASGVNFRKRTLKPYFTLDVGKNLLVAQNKQRCINESLTRQMRKGQISAPGDTVSSSPNASRMWGKLASQT